MKRSSKMCTEVSPHVVILETLFISCISRYNWNKMGQDELHSWQDKDCSVLICFCLCFKLGMANQNNMESQFPPQIFILLFFLLPSGRGSFFELGTKKMSWKRWPLQSKTPNSSICPHCFIYYYYFIILPWPLLGIVLIIKLVEGIGGAKNCSQYIGIIEKLN